MTYYFVRLSQTIDGTTLVRLSCPVGDLVTIRITDAGRIITVGKGNRQLHNRQHKGGPKLSSAKLRRCREIACAIVAMQALGHDLSKFPPQELKL